MTIPNPYHRADSLAELLLWDDVDFIRCAYVTMLGRQPEASGEAFYLVRLRAGQSKSAVLRQLRRSPEGRLHDPGIAGLDRALNRSRLRRIPIVGPLLRMFVAPAADDLVNPARAVAHEVAALRRSLMPGSALAVRAPALPPESEVKAERRPTKPLQRSAGADKAMTLVAGEFGR